MIRPYAVAIVLPTLTVTFMPQCTTPVLPVGQGLPSNGCSGRRSAKERRRKRASVSPASVYMVSQARSGKRATGQLGIIYRRIVGITRHPPARIVPF
jgi:hypothetical protein